MLWLLAIHISVLLLWCAALLSLPLLMASDSAWTGHGELHRPFDGVERFLYTHMATPAALAAILSGTVIFLFDRRVEFWLVIKLTLVTALVVCHVLTGLLVLRLERAETQRLQRQARILGITALAVMGAIVWVVLAKPGHTVEAVA
ncbi:MAG TPA: CopD family protein [Porticoccaceae bacterium]